MRIGGRTRAVRARWRGWSRWRRGALMLGSVAGALLLIAGAVGGALWAEDMGKPTAHTRGQDAYWLGHAWVDGRKSETDVAGLAKQLSGSGIRDLFVHTGPLSNDG